MSCDRFHAPESRERLAEPSGSGACPLLRRNRPSTLCFARKACSSPGGPLVLRQSTQLRLAYPLPGIRLSTQLHRQLVRSEPSIGKFELHVGRAAHARAAEHLCSKLDMAL